MESWSTNMEDRKSPSEPESSKALAGLPFIFTTTTMGLGRIRQFPFICAEFRCKKLDTYFDPPELLQAPLSLPAPVAKR